MANVYLRVPHYVASYLRNRDRNDAVEVGGEIRLNKSERIWLVFSEGLCPNMYGRVNRSYCFSQKQWNCMMGGFSLLPLSGGSQEKVLKRKEDELTLNDHEVELLAGLSIPRNDDSGEYICLRIPQEALRYGRLIPTNSSWYIRDSSANMVRKMLIDEFWRTLYAYADRCMDRMQNSGRKFSFMEMLDCFMERYSIFCSDDGHERNALRRNFNRRRSKYRFTDEDYIEFG